MKKSKEFENILNDCLERLLVSGQTLEQCLERYPEHSGELRPLLETAQGINRAATFQPRPEFREQARLRFRAALREKSYRSKRSFLNLGWQARWATAMISVILALLLAGGGTVAAASGSMPDEFLYPVKLATEQVRLTLTPSSLAKAELYAELTDRRVTEIARMTDENKPEEIEQTARLLETYLNRVVDLSSGQKLTITMKVAPAPVEPAATEEAAVTGDEPLPEPPALSAASEKAEMSQEPAITPEAAVTAPEEAEEDEKEQSGLEKAPGVAPAADQPDVEKAGKAKGKERIELKEKIEQRAEDNIARLRALLKTAPPSARPALLRAIALSEASYQKAIESLEDGE